MNRSLRPVSYNVDEVTEHLRFDEVSEEDKGLIESLGLPGANSLFDSDAKVAEKARREFGRSFFSAEPDDEQTQPLR